VNKYRVENIIADLLLKWICPPFSFQWSAIENSGRGTSLGNEVLQAAMGIDIGERRTGRNRGMCVELDWGIMTEGRC